MPALVTGRWRVSCVLTLMAQYFVFMLVFVFLDAFTFCFVLFFCFALLCFVLFPSVYCFSAFADRDGRRSASRVELSYVIWNGNPFPFTRFESACSHHTRIFHRTAAALPRQIRPFLRSTHTHTHTHARTQGSQAQLVCNPPTSFYHRKRSFRFLAPSTNLNSRTGI